jgi:transcriptional regulator with XRE-family HTH domain
MGTPSDHLPKTAARASQALQRIADALGVPVETLYDGEPAQAAAQVKELLYLWALLKSEPDRQKVLAFLRRLTQLQD